VVKKATKNPDKYLTPDACLASIKHIRALARLQIDKANDLPTCLAISWIFLPREEI